MLHRLIDASLRQRVFLLIVATVSVFIGLWSAYRLPIDAVPDITSPQVQVNTEVPALAPEETEKAVTIPLEMELAGIQGVEEMRSLTKFGLSQVTLIFKDGMDIYRARQLVAERLQAAADRLPPGLTPKLAPISTGLGEIYYYTLAYRPGATNRPADRLEELRELREIHEFVVKPMLRTTPGIAEINSSGGYEKQLVVQPRPKALQAAGLTFSELALVIGENVENTGGGVIHQGADQLIVRTVGRVRTAGEIAGLPVKFAAGVKPLLVSDLADVAVGSRFRTGAATENGQETILGTAMMLAGENSRIVAKRFADRIKEIQSNLPPGLGIRTQYDRSLLVDRTVATVKKNLFEGAILVVVVLLAMLGNWRAALIVSSAIPLSFLFALTGMVRWNISGNLMSLGAVDFGLIIDGAVVMVENIVRQLGERQHHLGRPLTAAERIHTVGAASKQVANPMFFGVLIITIVYVPILALTGVEGKMFHPMAITVMLALGGALVLALTLMPVLCSYLLGGSVREGDNLLVRGIKRLYEPSLRLVLRRPWLIAVSTVIWVTFSVLAFLRLGAEFVPKLDEGSHTVMVYRTNSMNLEASLAMEMDTEKLLLTIPEVERVFCRLGTSEVATDPMPPSQNDLYIFYKPRSQWRKVNGRPISKGDLAALLEEEIRRQVPAQTLLFAQPIEMRFNELLEGVRSDLSVKIIGYDYDVMEKLATQTKAVLDAVPGRRRGRIRSPGPRARAGDHRQPRGAAALQHSCGRREQGHRHRPGRPDGGPGLRGQPPPRNRRAPQGGTARPHRGNPRSAGAGGRARAGGARPGGRVQDGVQRGSDRPRGWPSPGGPHGQPAGSRRGELRQRGAGETGRPGTPARGLHSRVRRAVQESPGGAAAAAGGGAGSAGADFPAHLHGLR